MNHDELFLRQILEGAYITREQAAWLFEQRRQDSRIPIEQFLVQQGFLTPEQLQHIQTSWSNSPRPTPQPYSAPYAAPYATGVIRPVAPSGSGSRSRDSQDGRSKGGGFLEEGDALGAYEILSELARGGMGAVYKAVRHGSDEVVALKVMLADEADERAWERFRREIDAHKKLDHEHIISLRDSGQQGRKLFYTMEMLNGGSLADRIRKPKESLEEKVSIMLEVCRGVGYAHEQGIFHRDLKPQNVMFTEAGVAKVTDFGLAKSLWNQEALTKTGSALGTPNYMAPEQVSGETKTTDQRCDVWALGVILYEWIVGVKPFVGGTLPSLYMAILEEAPKKKMEAMGGLRQVIDRCLEKRAEHRYNHAGLLADDLQTWLERGHISVEGQSAPSRLIRRWVGQRKSSALGLALLVFAVVVGSGAYLYKRRLDQQAEENRRVSLLAGVSSLMKRASERAVSTEGDIQAAFDANDLAGARSAIEKNLSLVAKARRALGKLEKIGPATIDGNILESFWKSAVRLELGRIKCMTAGKASDKDWQAALQEIDELSSQTKGKPELEAERLIQKSVLEGALGRWSEALRSVSGVKAEDLTDADLRARFHGARGDVLVNSWAPALAVEEYSLALKSSPSPRWETSRAHARWLEGRSSARALEQLKALASKGSKRARLLYLEDSARHDGESFLQVLPSLRKSFQKERAGFWSGLLSRAYLERGWVDEAFVLLKESSRLSPDEELKIVLLEAMVLSSEPKKDVVRDLDKILQSKTLAVGKRLSLLNLKSKLQGLEKSKEAFQGLAVKHRDRDAVRHDWCRFELSRVFSAMLSPGKEGLDGAKIRFKALFKDPKDPAVSASIAAFEVFCGSREKGLAGLQEVLKRDPGNPFARLIEAMGKGDDKLLAEAFAAYNSSGSLAVLLHRYASQQFERIESYGLKKEYAEAYSKLALARRLAPWYLPCYTKAIEERAGQGHWKKAKVLCLQVLELFPENSLSLAVLSLIASQSKKIERHEAALELAERACARDGKSAWCREAMLGALLALGKLAKAGEFLDGWLKDEPYCLIALQARVKLLKGAKDEKSLARLKEMSESIRGLTDPGYIKGTLEDLEKVADAESAEKAFEIAERAMLFQPREAECLLKRAATRRMLRSEEQNLLAYLDFARIFLIDIKQLDDPLYDFRNLIRFTLPLDRFDQLLPKFKKWRDSPEAGFARVVLAYIEMLNGYRKAASLAPMLADLDRVLVSYPGNITVLLLKGSFRIFLGDVRGRRQIQRCLRSFPKLGVALLMLALIEVRGSRLERAFQFLEKAEFRSEVARLGQVIPDFAPMTKLDRWRKLSK